MLVRGAGGMEDTHSRGGKDEAWALPMLHTCMLFIPMCTYTYVYMYHMYIYTHTEAHRLGFGVWGEEFMSFMMKVLPSGFRVYGQIKGGVKYTVYLQCSFCSVPARNSWLLLVITKRTRRTYRF